MTLVCQSGDRTDTFLLSQEGAAHRPLRLRAQDQGGQFQAEFSLSPVSSAHGGTYRCYRALSTEPHLLSRPSKPLALLVSGEAQWSALKEPPLSRVGVDGLQREPRRVMQMGTQASEGWRERCPHALSHILSLGFSGDRGGG